VKRWCIGTPSAQYVAKMEEVLDVYQRPYDPQKPVICIDEGGKELRSIPRGQLALQPGQTTCQDYEYERHGKSNLFMAVEPLGGWRKVFVTERHTKLDFAEVLRYLVDEAYPHAEKLVLVTDNLNIHAKACLYERFLPEEAHRIAGKLEWHYTPEHGSWLNVAECELSVLARQCLARPIPDPETLQRQALAWETKRNTAQATVSWHFTAADARIKLKRLYPVVKV
jgi:DDE superfamily endonuclease